MKNQSGNKNANKSDSSMNTASSGLPNSRNARVGRAVSKSRTRSTIIFIIIVAAIAILTWLGGLGATIGDYMFTPITANINKGLDLKGGVSLVEEVQDKNVSADTMKNTVNLLSQRVNKLGVSETTVTQEGTNRIRIEIPGVYDAQEVINTVGKTGELKFTGPDNATILTGKDVKQATAYADSQTNQPVVGLQLSSTGAAKFADATAKFMGQKIDIYMDQDVIESATVQAHITDGNAVITGIKSMDDARRTASLIQSGALPVTVKAVQSSTVGATLGANALPQSVLAAKIGIGLVFLFMLINYRVPGLIADIALVLYILLVLGTFAIIKATLTLSGIAAFLLTVGMAVDANVLIFERIKEELRTGKSIRSAFEAGFKRALSSILDSNTTTIISGLVLYYLGTGTVKGFALTLVIGVIMSMLTAIIVTRYLMKLAVDMGILDKLSHFGVKRGVE
jgi:preprotein translocase subunit SecD